MTRLFVVDEPKVAHRNLADLIRTQRDVEIVGECGSSHALARVKNAAPDVVAIDVSSSDSDGADLCRDIFSTRVGVQCILLTTHQDDQAGIAAALEAATAHLRSDVDGQSLASSTRCAPGFSILSRTATEQMLASLETPAVDGCCKVPDLTLRERQILQLITDGLTNRQIGIELGLREKTIKNYVSGLLAKLGMERRTQAAVYGARHTHGHAPASTRPSTHRPVAAPGRRLETSHR